MSSFYKLHGLQCSDSVPGQGCILSPTCLLAGAVSWLAGEATKCHLCLGEKEDTMLLDMVKEDIMARGIWMGPE